MTDECIIRDVAVEQSTFDTQNGVQFVAVGVVITRAVTNKAVECEETFTWIQDAVAVAACIRSNNLRRCQDWSQAIGQTLTFVDEEETNSWCVAAK